MTTLLRFALVLLCFSAPYAYAQEGINRAQLHFSMEEGNNENTYHFQWIDNTFEPKKVSFKLDAGLVRDSIDEFKPIDDNDIQSFTFGAAKAFVALRQKQGVPIKIHMKQNGYTLESRGLSKAQINQELAKIDDLIKKAQYAYVENRLYEYVESEESYFPAYTKIADDYRDKLEPLSDALIGKTIGMEFRERVNLVLSFFQSIPYDTLQNRKNSNGSGFATPIELLHQNRGDCDTKSTAFASIMRTMYYRIPMIMVFIPGHAFVGLETPAQPGDETLDYKGRTYILSEPVGPSIRPFGSIGPDSAAKLREHDYRVVSFEHWSLDK
ncbi:MAG: hypothetical protein CMF62_13235 [Magnetococcales bacterium]|nr:hypothetical protein [Magnetococcales bacterium]